MWKILGLESDMLCLYSQHHDRDWMGNGTMCRKHWASTTAGISFVVSSRRAIGGSVF